MTSDRREDKKLTREEVKKVLNRKQLASLLECQYFGWRLKFIRSPACQEPVPVLYNAEIDQIGILEPDGYINMDNALEVRSPALEPSQRKQTCRIPREKGAESWNEKRKDMLPVPENFREMLNLMQINALHQIESFGWQLDFVRRPLFQDPVPVILSPDGKKYATLERDGRINMVPGSDLRKQVPAEQPESTPSVKALKSSRSR